MSIGHQRTTQALRVKDLHEGLGVSKGHASEILSGETSPSLKLAIKIFRRFGTKLGPIAGASKIEIDTLEKVGARVPQ